IYNGSTNTFESYLGYSYWAAVDPEDPDLWNEEKYEFVKKLNESDEKYQIYELMIDNCSVEDAPFGKIITFMGYFTDKMPRLRDYWIDYRVFGADGKELWEDWGWTERFGGYDVVRRLAIEHPVAFVKILGSKEHWWYFVNPGDWFVVQAIISGSTELIEDIDGLRLVFHSYDYWERVNESYWIDTEIIVTIDYLQNETFYEAYNRTEKCVLEYGEYETWNETSGRWEIVEGWHWEYYMYNQSSGEWVKGWLPWHGKETLVYDKYIIVTNFTKYEIGTGKWVFEANITLNTTMPENNYWFDVFFTNWTYGEDLSAPYGKHEIITWVKEKVYSFEDINGEKVYVEPPEKELYVTNDSTKYPVKKMPYIKIGDKKYKIIPEVFWVPLMGERYYNLLRWAYWDPTIGEEVWYYLVENDTHTSKVYVYPGYAGYIYNWTFPDEGISVLSFTQWMHYDWFNDEYYIFLLNGSILKFDPETHYMDPIPYNDTIELDFAGWVVFVNFSTTLEVKRGGFDWDYETGSYYIELTNGTIIYLDRQEDPYLAYYFERNGKIYFVDWPTAYYNGTYNGNEVIVYAPDVRHYYYTEIHGEKYPMPVPEVRADDWWLLNTPEPEGAVPVDYYVLYNGSLYPLMRENKSGMERLFIETENGTVGFMETMDDLENGDHKEWWTKIKGEGHWLEVIGERVAYGYPDDIWHDHLNITGYLDIQRDGWSHIDTLEDGTSIYVVSLINGTIIQVNRSIFVWVYKVNYSGTIYYVRSLDEFWLYTENCSKPHLKLLNGSYLEINEPYEIMEAILIKTFDGENFTFNGEVYNLSDYDWDILNCSYMNTSGKLYLVDRDDIWRTVTNLYNVTYNGHEYTISSSFEWIRRKEIIWGYPYTWHHEEMKISMFQSVHEMIVGSPEWGMWGYRAWTVDPDTGALDLDGDLSTTDDRFYVKRVYVGTYNYNFTADGMFVHLLWDPNASELDNELDMDAWMGISTHYWKYTWNETYYWYYAENMSLVSNETMEEIRSTVLDDEGNPKPGYWDIARMVNNMTWEDILAMAREKGWDWISDDYQSWTWMWFGFAQHYHTSWIENNTEQWASVTLRYEYAGLLLYNDSNGDGVMDEGELTHYFMPDSIENFTFITPGMAYGDYNRSGVIIVPGDEEVNFGIMYEGINGTTFPADHSIWWWYGGEAPSGSDFNTFNTRPVGVSIDFMMFKLHFQGNLTQDELGNREAYVKIDQYVGDWDVMLSRGREVLENRSMAISYYVYLETATEWSVYTEENRTLTNEEIAEAAKVRIGVEDVSFAEIVLGDQYLWTYNYTMQDAAAQTTPIYTYQDIYVGYNSPSSATGWTFTSTMYVLTIGFPLWDGYAVYQDPLEIINIGHKGEEAEFIDSDGDGIPDQWEIDHGLNPNDPSDAQEDPDNDGLTNLDEYLHDTDPWNPDTDSDGMPDGWEVQYSLDPKDPSDAQEDPDNDGLTNLEEYQYGTNPRLADTDGDGYTDGEEVENGTDPTDPNSYPGAPTQVTPPPTGGGLPMEYLVIIVAVVAVVFGLIMLRKR
ncbi:hypothetical protein DRO49_00750, partial [Candidatus Bathyarchaeota archaeon]